MKRFVWMPAAALILSAGLMSTAASAAPAAGQALKPQSVAGQSLVEQVRHNCRRVCKGWGFKRKCKMVCRGGDRHHHHHHRRHRH
jgi:hypothetical protein